MRQLLKFLTILLFAEVVLTKGNSAPVGNDQAESVAKAWLQTKAKPLRTSLGKEIGKVIPFRDSGGRTLAYIVLLRPDGFVVVGADTEIEPIIAFGAKGGMSFDKDNPLRVLLERDMGRRLDDLNKNAEAAVTMGRLRAEAKWENLSGMGARPQDTAGLENVDDLRVAPLLSTTWSQGAIYQGQTLVACYNYYTPPYGPGNPNNFPTGCGSTALAQIMRYFQYPTQGVGIQNFTFQINEVPTAQALRGGDGAGGPYQWNEMVQNPGNGTTTQQCEAIGALMANVGMEGGADYTASGSSIGFGGGAVPIWAKTFGYANAVCGGPLNDGWIPEINPNLDAHLPVCLCIEADQGGHVVVCDGYGYDLGTAYDHINLGWGGECDAWYNLPDVNTEPETPYDFTSIWGIYYNIFPQATGEIISGRVVTQRGTPLNGVHVSAAQVEGLTYDATTDTNGIFAFVGMPSGAVYTMKVAPAGYTPAASLVQTRNSTWGACGNVWMQDWVVGTNADMGMLQVVLGPDTASTAGAQWQVDNGYWQNSWNMVSNLTLGSHTVSFKPVSFWESPASRSVTINAGTITQINANYCHINYAFTINGNSITITGYSGLAGTCGDSCHHQRISGHQHRKRCVPRLHQLDQRHYSQQCHQHRRKCLRGMLKFNWDHFSQQPNEHRCLSLRNMPTSHEREHSKQCHKHRGNGVLRLRSDLRHHSPERHEHRRWGVREFQFNKRLFSRECTV